MLLPKQAQMDLKGIVQRDLKGLSHEIFRPVIWDVWVYLGLNVNPLWFLNFNDAPFILDTYFKFWRVSGQTFSEILRISEKDWHLSLRFSIFHRFLVSSSPEKRCLGWKYFSENRRISENDWQLSPQFSENDWQLSPQLSKKDWQRSPRLPILLGDSKNLREGLN